MPYVKIQTNTPLASEAKQPLLSKISRQVADALNKPERYVMVDLAGNAAMVFAGSGDPAAYIELKSIDLPDTQTQHLSQMLCLLLHDELTISPERIYIEFTDIPRKFWGWNGSTF